jgi:leader peptidase (prepilin peptidase)/N-methyltransferase
MPRRLFWMELATGIIFVFLYWWCVILKPDLGITAFAVMAFYACLFIIIFVLIIGAILGGVVAIVLVVVKKRKRKEMIPFGPFLSLAAMVTLLWGSQILNWYLGLM